MATAEFAVALPAVVLALVIALAGVGAGIDRVRCVDAARVAARSLARGDPIGSATAKAAAAAPGGAAVSITGGPVLVTVRVVSTRSAPGGFARWTVEGTATADREVPP